MALEELLSVYEQRLTQIAMFRITPALRSKTPIGHILLATRLKAVNQFESFTTDDSGSAFLWFRSIILETTESLNRQYQRNNQQKYAKHTAAVSLCDLMQLEGSHAEFSKLQMNDTDLEILALCHFEKLTNREVASITGLKRRDVVVTYVRAMYSIARVQPDGDWIQYAHEIMRYYQHASALQTMRMGV